MNILIIGSEGDLDSCRKKFGSVHVFGLAEKENLSEATVAKWDVVFDFKIYGVARTVDIYRAYNGFAFFNCATVSLANTVRGKAQYSCKVVGFNGLPGFFENELLEISLLSVKDRDLVLKFLENLGVKAGVVEDRVGLVTPRILAMIINEAYYTVQEKTASRDDIDKAMKLGTNYPFGPFEWAKRIGLTTIYEVLRAVYSDTKDERYKISPLLKKEYLEAGGRDE
jgi:3-hydroxybutyryl-CoA dehydrogenase